MADNTTTTTATTPTSYDLIAINGTSIPDVKKGDVVVAPNPKYIEYDGEEGNKIIDKINTTMLKGSVAYNGLLQSELQTIYGLLNDDVVATLTIYNPMKGTTKTFSALILIGDIQKIIHDSGANAWTFSFDFEEIDDAPST